VRRLLLCCLLLAGCSGGSAPAPASKADIADLEARGQLSGCVASTQPLTVRAALCTSGSDQVTLATFTGNSQRDLWVTAQRAVASGYLVTGDSWAASALDADTAGRLAAALGGTLT
jgi:hypothetical protein